MFTVMMISVLNLTIEAINHPTILILLASHRFLLPLQLESLVK